MSKRVVIVGGGPAGLTAAHELCQYPDYRPIVFEMETQLGGISKTVRHNGNRMDLGGHRFFSKSDWVMNWWLKHLPMQNLQTQKDLEITYQRSKRPVHAQGGENPDEKDLVMLVRERQSRILFGGRFFDYPLSLSATTLRNLGLWRCIKFGISFVAARFSFRDENKNLESFFIRRFGKELYQTFFKSYTEKVWGQPCDQISASWGAQRIKGLSISKAVTDAAMRLLGIKQKKVETSLIEKFLYPKLGPGQLWEEVGRKITQMGGEIALSHKVVGVSYGSEKIKNVTVEDLTTGTRRKVECDYLISSMPIPELLLAFDQGVPAPVMEVANALRFRDFVTVGVLLKRLGPKFASVKDTWLYVQDPSVKVGRIQFFNQWSPYLVAQPDTEWVGLEYFCEEGDALSLMTDSQWLDLVKKEIEQLGLGLAEEVLDTKLVRVPKAYPAYWGGFEQMPVIRSFVDRCENLFLVGRNGMHRYNNQDHSMLTASMAVNHILTGKTEKAAIWEINTEEEYHETKVEVTEAEPEIVVMAPA